MEGWSRGRARLWLAASGGTLLVGGLVGAIGAVTLDPSLGRALERAISLYLGSWLSATPAAGPLALWRTALGLELRVAALAWIGGLLPLGWILTLAVLFAEGFAQGFALTALAGAVPASVGLAAAAPALAVAALLAGLGAASLSLAQRQQRARRGGFPPPRAATYAVYGIVLAAAVAALAGLALVQAYALPWAVRLLAGSPAGLAHPWQM